MKNNGIDSGEIAKNLASIMILSLPVLQGLAHCLNPCQMQVDIGLACDWNRSFPRNRGTLLFGKFVFLI